MNLGSRDVSEDWVLFDMFSITNSLRFVRRTFRRAVVVARHGSISDSPVFFANSFPKSGTHLLTQVLHGFTSLGPAVDSGLPAVVMYEGSTGIPFSDDILRRKLHQFHSGDIGYGHLHAKKNLKDVLTSENFASYFIFRDPRDVVVSHVHYVTEMEPEHVHHRYYSQTLKTFEQRLKTSILGLPDITIPFPSIHDRFEPYIGWLELEQVLSIRFEDFIQHRESTLEKILDHALNRGFQILAPKQKAVDILVSFIQPEKSPTFRTGTVGRWRDVFSPEMKTIFKDVAGDLLIRLGYEKGFNW